MYPSAPLANSITIIFRSGTVMLQLQACQRVGFVGCRRDTDVADANGLDHDLGGLHLVQEKLLARVDLGPVLGEAVAPLRRRFSETNPRAVGWGRGISSAGELRPFPGPHRRSIRSSHRSSSRSLAIPAYNLRWLDPLDQASTSRNRDAKCLRCIRAT